MLAERVAAGSCQWKHFLWSGGLPHLTEKDVTLMELATDDDLALVNECLRLEYEMRQRAYAAVQRLLGYANLEDGDLSERLLALPLQPFADAATCLRARMD